MSGSDAAAAGAWPAEAALASEALASRPKMKPRMALLLLHVHARHGLPRGRGRRRRGGRQRLADRQPHGGDLLLLVDDDLLRQASDLRVAPVAEHGHRHVDRALMV